MAYQGTESHASDNEKVVSRFQEKVTVFGGPKISYGSREVIFEKVDNTVKKYSKNTILCNKNISNRNHIEDVETHVHNKDINKRTTITKPANIFRRIEEVTRQRKLV